MTRKLIFPALVLGLFAAEGKRAGADSIGGTPIPAGASDAVLVKGMKAPLFVLETDKSEFKPKFLGPALLPDQAVQLFQDTGLTTLSDQIWVKDTSFFFASDPNLVDLGPKGLDIPINKILAEDGSVQDLSPYFKDLRRNPLPAGSVLVFSDLNPTPEVPEPATLTLLGISLAGMAGYGWRKRKTAAA